MPAKDIRFSSEARERMLHGVTAAKEIQLPDHFENMGAQMVRPFMAHLDRVVIAWN